MNMWKIGNVNIKNKIVLAPMAGVTNIAFRQIAKEMNVGLVCTEMISIMGIAYNSQKTIELTKINKNERPISMQIFGSDIESFKKAAIYINNVVHPDIIDINMGCPVPKVAIKSQAGSSLLKNPNKIYEIVKTVVESVTVPVTVKIRSGWDKNSINALEIAKLIEKAGASAITIHPRTRSQGYSGQSDWNLIKIIKENVSIPVIGNGDIKTIFDAKQMLDQTKCDAIMIGRAALGNPWFLMQCEKYIENEEIINNPNNEEIINMMKHHYTLIKNERGEKSAILEFRTHALWYLKLLKNAKEYKNKIISVKTEIELEDFFEEIRKKF